MVFVLYQIYLLVKHGFGNITNQSEGIIQKGGMGNILQEGGEVVEEIEEEGDTGEELENRRVIVAELLKGRKDHEKTTPSTPPYDKR